MSERCIDSKRLNDILDSYGLSEENVEERRIFWDKITCSLFFHSFGTRGMFYITGSVREGVRDLTDEDSDLDVMAMYNVPIVKDYRDNTQHSCSMTKLVLFMRDSSNPGYKIVTLAADNNVQPNVFFNDYLNIRDYLLNLRTQVIGGNPMHHLMSGIYSVEKKGPSCNLSDIGGISDVDMVFSLKCPDFPVDAAEWRYRRRRLWPTQKTIDKIVSKGCHLVKVGSSAQSNNEWRLSFVVAENILVRSFNDTQLKCYALLKYVLKMFITPKAGNIICSYHLKMLMFWLCENKSPLFWRKDQLKECFVFCLRELRQQVEDNCCPNYFVRNMNLFLGKVDSSNKNIILTEIDKLLEEGVVPVLRCIALRKPDTYKQKNLINCVLMFRHLCDVINIDTLINNWPEKSVAGIQCLIKRFFQGISEFANVDKDIVCTHTSRFMFTATCIELALVSDSNLSNKETYQEIRRIMNQLNRLSNYDFSSGKLKFATICLKLNKIGDCIKICKAIVNCDNGSVLRLSSRLHVDILLQHFIKYMTSDIRITSFELLERLSCSDVIFTPFEIGLVPEAIQHEMVREKKYDSLLYPILPSDGWCYFDPIIYAYYLLLICYHEIGQTENRDRTFTQLEDVFFNQRQKYCFTYPEAAEILIEYCRRLVNDEH